MELPNDLIKATDYEKAKHREIKEFECVNGKVIQHYVLGGEHELTMQEIIDCLNALTTIDCDLQTAYAYIEGKKDKISDLEAKLAEKDKEIKALKSKEKKIQLHSKRYWFERCCRLENVSTSLELENIELKQQLHDLPKKIVEDCKMALIKRINTIGGYGRMTIDEQSFLFENEYGKDLDTILKKYGGENE